MSEHPQRPAGPESDPSDGAMTPGESGPGGAEPLLSNPWAEPMEPGDEGEQEAAPTGSTSPADPVRAVEPPADHDSFITFLKELPVLLLVAFGLAFLLRTFVLQVFYIPSASMRPTLVEDDRIVVEKLSYRFGDPSRGDVVVFAGEDRFSTTVNESGVQRVIRGVGQFLGVVPVDARDLVKRIIGLPGDVVELHDGVVSVNGVELDEPYAALDNDDGRWEVPEGQVFVMGDNRSNSADSRSSLGFVDMDDIVGRAIVKIWPFDRAGSIEGGGTISDGSVPAPGDDAGALPPLGAMAIPVIGFVAARPRD